ncbi:peptidase M20/M25/M40 family protein [Striga asiatica]|uniref:Peptidase M20/M25/M40 family protein n=1 Tax=Striga asiatica TaxID=4170 RepID=A0A5A7PB11_STRAF|nr:peptidase M20/M25/M40 family protein [Striga asiatica]
MLTPQRGVENWFYIQREESKNKIVRVSKRQQKTFGEVGGMCLVIGMLLPVMRKRGERLENLNPDLLMAGGCGWDEELVKVGSFSQQGNRSAIAVVLNLLPINLRLGLGIRLPSSSDRRL